MRRRPEILESAGLRQAGTFRGEFVVLPPSGGDG
jgi:hypothetical protein